MPYDLAGIFTRLYDFEDDRDNGVAIRADRMDGEFDNYQGGLNLAFLRDGRAAMTGTLKMGTQAMSGLISGSAGAPAISFNSDAVTGMYLQSAGVLAFAASGLKSFSAVSGGISILGGLEIGLGASGLGVDVGLSWSHGAFDITTELSLSRVNFNSAGNTVRFRNGSTTMFSYTDLATTFGQPVVLSSTATIATAAYATANTGLANTAFVDRLRDRPVAGSVGERGAVSVITTGQTLNTGVTAGTFFYIYNDSAGNLTITEGIGLTLRLAGTATTGNRTLAQRGWSSIWAKSTTEYIMSGDGVS